jgi:hypothetical protein
MNCPDVRVHLPALVYGDLNAQEVAAVEVHLTTCPACRKERTDLERVRQALTAMPAPTVEVDVHRIFRQAADRQARRARRWRRAALALGAAAALLLFVVGLRLEVRAEAGQLVIRWGNAPAKEIEPAPRKAPTPRVVAEQPGPDSLPELERRLRLNNDLIHAVAQDVEDRDRTYRDLLTQLRAALDTLARQTARQWTETERNVAALYVFQNLLKKGNEP